MEKRSLLIIGCGYVGKELGKFFITKGWHVVGWVHSSDSANQLIPLGIEPYAADVAQAKSWFKVSREFDWAVFCASTRGGGKEVYENVYLRGMEQMVKHLDQGTEKLFTSSTSVYGQTDGSWVSEESLAEPKVETGKVLRLAEEICLAQTGAVARLAGIYGPSRSITLQRILEGTASLDGTGERWVNQIYRDDIILALAFIIENNLKGILNICDDCPVQQYKLYEWLSNQLKVCLSDISQPTKIRRKRGFTNKRVSNHKLKSIGWQTKYPSYQEGYLQLLR